MENIRKNENVNRITKTRLNKNDELNIQRKKKKNMYSSLEFAQVYKYVICIFNMLT